MPIINSRFLYFLLCIVLITGCNRCKEECDDPTNPECPNYCPPLPVDPCEGHTEVSADFTVMQQAAIAGNFLDTLKPCFNKVLSGNREISLHALEEDASYTWIVGSDTLHGQDYQFVIPTSFEGQIINITLIVEKVADTLCFPLDDGMDTLIRSFEVISSCNALPWGIWHGAWDNAPLDSFNIAFIRYDDPNFPGEDCGLRYMKGHHQVFTDSTYINGDGLTSNYLFFRSTTGPQYSPDGMANISEDGNHVIIDYTMLVSNVFPDNDGATVKHIFRGYRIN